MDQHVEDAFRLNVKWSLQEISKAINGDGKSSPNPLFRIKVVLQTGKHGAQEVNVRVYVVCLCVRVYTTVQCTLCELHLLP